MNNDTMRNEQFWKLSKCKDNYHGEYLGVINHDDERFLVRKAINRSSELGVLEANLPVIQMADFVIDLKDGMIIKNRYGGNKYNDLELAIEAREWKIKH